MKILAINGGGTLGYIIAGLLSKIENELGKQCYEIFDLIGGPSTGSIISSNLCLGVSAEKIKTDYRKFAEEVFGNPKWFLLTLFYSKYDICKLETLLKENINGNTLNDCKTNFMTYALDISSKKMKTKYWKSWKEDDKNNKLYQVVCASSSAPTFFDPYVVNETAYIDGALVENNPTMSCIAEGINFGYKLEDIKCLNIAAFSNEGLGLKKAKKFRGIIDVAPKISALYTSGGSTSNNYQAKRILDEGNFCEVFPEFEEKIDSQDFDTFDNVIEDLWQVKKDNIISFLLKDE